MTTIATVLAVAGTAVSAAGTIAGGMMKADAANFAAGQYERRADEEQVAGQREAQDIRRKTTLIQSRNQALSAASGFSATDASSLDLIGDIAQEGALQEDYVKYGANSRAGAHRASAIGMRMEGRAARIVSYFDAASTIIGGASGFYDKYGGRAASAMGAPMDIRPAAMRYA